MSESINDEIDRGWELYTEGKLEEALNLVQEIEIRKALTRDINLRCQILKGILWLHLERFEEINKMAKDYNIIQESKGTEDPLILIEAFGFVFLVFYIFRSIKIQDEIEYVEKFLKELSTKRSNEVKVYMAILNTAKSWGYWSIGELDPALELMKESIEIIKNSSRWSWLLFTCNVLLGHIYENKGELDIALKSLNKCLENFKINSPFFKGIKASALNKFGAVYYQQGDLDLAVKYYKESLNLLKQTNTPIMGLEATWAYSALISIFLDMNSPELANEYLRHFDNYYQINKYPFTKAYYDLSEARILKLSTRIRDKARAEIVFKNLIESDYVKVDVRFLTQATIEICDYYLGELRSTNDLKILEDIQPYLELLLKESERSNSYSLQSHTNLFQGKLSLLQMNMGDARRYLTQAEKISDEHGLQLLAREISKEHDKLLEQLNKWEALKKEEISMPERLSLAGLNNSIDLIQGKRVIKAPELVNEDSVMLLIIAEGGILLFSYSFSEELKVDDDVFGSFLSAFTTFSNEIFSEGLDRAKFGQFTVLLDTADKFSICYLFKGQTYMAKKKLADFTESLQSNVSIMQTLNKYCQLNQVIEVKDFPFLEGFINRIFTKN
ncbi:MAG: tetratricopeptide repeat protein [Candidatus Thorarchaeota archaeon]